MALAVKLPGLFLFEFRWCHLSKGLKYFIKVDHIVEAALETCFCDCFFLHQQAAGALNPVLIDVVRKCRIHYFFKIIAERGDGEMYNRSYFLNIDLLVKMLFYMMEDLLQTGIVLFNK